MKRPARTYVMGRLLQHGRLSTREIREITGWPPLHVAQTLHYLLKLHQVRRINIDRAPHYQLTDFAPFPRLYD